MPTIRAARPSDAKGLAELAERTFRETFAAVNTPEDMELHCKAGYGEALQAAEISNPELATLVSEEAGALVGFALLGWGKAPAGVVAQRPGEIQRLYVDAAWHGRGVAQGLMSACLEEFRRRRSDVVWLGVWERNPRAIAFYKKVGFAETGEKAFRLGTDLQRDIVMTRPRRGLAKPPSSV
ncbi:MAG: acetyltransferase [Elusimicrobia bacterium]|nr:MAG: acetyltransferase [Elusimicrobiota bacterium]